MRSQTNRIAQMSVGSDQFTLLCQRFAEEEMRLGQFRVRSYALMKIFNRPLRLPVSHTNLTAGQICLTESWRKSKCLLHSLNRLRILFLRLYAVAIAMLIHLSL